MLKMVPSGEKFELRIKGPLVFPGYLNRSDLTRDAFDDDGFYKIGDAGLFADPTDPSKGISFAGRIAEDYKLTTGTWVHVGKTRVEVLNAAAPLLQDALVTGHDREYVGILAWPNIAGCRELCGDKEATLTLEELVRGKEVVEHIRLAMSIYNGTHIGSATRVRRVMLMTEPPSIDANEITDKGYINQRAVLETRKDLVKLLYAEVPGATVIDCAPRAKTR
jgi:feruloyl-CoA synthase